MPVARSGAGDVAHGVVEGHTQDLDVKINGIAGEVALGPAPVTVLEDEAGMGGQNIIVRLACEEQESAFLEQRRQWRQSRGADLLAGPALISRQWVGHSLFSSGVG